MFVSEIFGPDLIVVIVIIVALLFLGPQIPKVARSLGSAKSEFEKGQKESAQANKATDAEAKPTDSGSTGTETPPSAN